MIIRATCAQQERLNRFEIDFRLKPLAPGTADIGDKKIAAAGIVDRLLYVLPVDAVSGYINR